MKTYYLRFGTGAPSNYTGLTPTMTVFAAGGVTAIAAPPITESPAGSGLYKFAFGPTLSMLFVCDGGATLSSAFRYIVGALDPADAVDETTAAMGSTLLGAGATLAGVGATLSGVGANLLAVGSTLSFTATGVVATGVTLTAMGSTLVGTGVTLSGMGATLSGAGSTLLGVGATLASAAAAVGATDDAIGSNVADPGSIFGFVKRLREFLEGNAVFTKAGGAWQVYDRSGATLLATKTLTNSSTQATKS